MNEMSRKHNAAIAAALAALTMGGILPGAAYAQSGRRDRQEDRYDRREDRRDRREDRRDQREDRWDRREDRWDARRDDRWDNRRNDRRDDRWDNRRTDRREAERRQDTKNDWRNLAIAAGGVAAFGLIQRDPTIAFAGAAGALYSLNRYEQDRRSQSAASRARAGIFSQPYFYRDGRRYERREVTSNGQRCYQFVRR